MSFKKDLANVFLAKIINVGIGIILGFLVPIYLSINEYGNLNVFLLYISYAGIFHFGFIDGLYIKYGGKRFKNLNSKILKYEHNFLVIMELIILTILIGLALLTKNKILFYCGISIFPLNMISFYKYIYEATGEFKNSVRITNVFNLLTLLMNLVLIFFIRTYKFTFFIYGYLFVYYIVFIFIEINYLYKYKNVVATPNLQIVKNNIKVGIFILLGNLATSFFYTIDKWFVKGLFSIDKFAFYSFATSMMNVINVFVNSVALTLYSYLVRNNEEERMKKIKDYLILLGTFSFTAYFIFSGIVHMFIPKYIKSLSVVNILFMGLPYYFVINILYLNLYKAKKIEKKYFKTVLIMLVISIIANLIAISINKDLKSIAIATDISFIIWYLYSMKDFKFLNFTLKEFVYLICTNLLFIILSLYSIWYISIFVYVLVILILIFIFYKKSILDLICRKS